MDSLSFLVCLLMAWFAIHLFVSKAMKRSHSNTTRLPPGPNPLPIVGNLFSLGTKPQVSLAELAKIYGPLMLLQLGWVPTVVISSAAVAKEALQKHDIHFSNRTVLDAVRSLDHHHNSIAFLPAGPKWRTFRKICNSQVFSTTRLEERQCLRRHKVRDLLSYVHKCSEEGIAVDINQAAFVTTLNLLSNSIFSADLADFSSESASQFKEIVRVILDGLGTPNLADYFPFLSFLLPLLIVLIAAHLLTKIKKPRSPPGPCGLPIFGNLFTLGPKPHIALSELAKTYGPLMTLHLGQVPTVVISSSGVAKEALQKNDLLFSNRTVIDAVQALNHSHNSVAWLPVGPEWRNLRKIEMQ